MTATYLHDLESLDLASALDVGTPAQIDKSTAPVDGALFAGHQLVNVVKLVLAVCEHLLEVLLGDLQPVEALLLLEDTRGFVVQGRPISLPDDTTVSQLAWKLLKARTR